MPIECVKGKCFPISHWRQAQHSTAQPSQERFAIYDIRRIEFGRLCIEYWDCNFLNGYCMSNVLSRSPGDNGKRIWIRFNWIMMLDQLWNSVRAHINNSLNAATSTSIFMRHRCQVPFLLDPTVFLFYFTIYFHRLLLLAVPSLVVTFISNPFG